MVSSSTLSNLLRVYRSGIDGELPPAACEKSKQPAKAKPMPIAVSGFRRIASRVS
jgi:hypothetical protein